MTCIQMACVGTACTLRHSSILTIYVSYVCRVLLQVYLVVLTGDVKTT